MKKQKELFLKQIFSYIKKEKTLDELYNYTEGVIDAFFPNADIQFREMIKTFAGDWQTYYIMSNEIKKEFRRYQKLDKGQQL